MFGLGAGEILVIGVIALILLALRNYLNSREV